MRSSRSRLAHSAAAALVGALALSPLVAAGAASAALVPEPIVDSADGAVLSLAPIGTFESGVFDESAAEIIQAYGDRLFVVNAQAGSVTVLDYSDPTKITKLFEIASEGVANSVAVREDGLGVIAFEAPEKTDPGHLLFFDANAADAASAALGQVTVGALPDMVTVSADGTYAVVANEGEPAADFSTDPEGSVSIVTLPEGVAAPAQDAVRIADFHNFEASGSQALDDSTRVFGPRPETDFPVSRNLEPEYIALDGGTAYAALQEANAVAVIDLESATVTDIWGLGFKDHSVEGNGIDANNDDEVIDIRTFENLKGMYLPDGINAYQAGGETYLVTANEGDAREWGDYVESVRVKDLADEGYGPVCDAVSTEGLKRLNVSIEEGFDAAADCYNELYAFGARSFSIWKADGTQVFDSGDDFEQITAAVLPDGFNSNHSETKFDNRSDDKGPEPENLTIGELNGKTYAFIGFERVGGVIVYDITDPAAATYVTYINNRDFSVSVEDADDPAAALAAAGDLGPEGLTFIPAETSVTGEPLLAVANEVSGTMTLFSITDSSAPTTTKVQVLTVNDFHGRIEPNFGNGEAGAAVLAGAVDSFEAENPNTLFVSAGDNIGASTFTSFIDQDNPTIDVLAAAGLDVSAVGNHEFDRGFADLTDRVLPRYSASSFADFGLGANVYLKGTKTPALAEYTVKEVDGVRVAFIGTVTADTAAMVTPSGIADIEFGDQLEAANRAAAEITAADAADVTVLLAHTGTAQSSCEAVEADGTDFGALVKGASSEIDAIVSAHTHQSYSCLIAGPDGEKRPVIQAHQYGTTLGTLDIEVDNKTKDIVAIEGALVPLVDADAEQPLFSADPEVEALVAAATANAEEEGSVEIGAISADITRGGDPAGSDRGVESTLGNTIADLYLWATSNENYAGTKAQIGIMNPGGLRADLLYGENGTITYKDAASVQPFANTLVTLTLTGAQLKAVLEEQWQPDGSERPKLHLGISAGLSYEYNPDAPRGERILSLSYQGKPIAGDDSFMVVTNSFLADGGDNFTTLASGTDRTDTGQVDLAATLEFFSAFDVVDPAPLGRAVLHEEEPAPVDPVEPAPVDPGPWGVLSLNATSVPQGGALKATVSGLEPGQQVTAVLHSEPLTIAGIPTADAAGNVTFTVTIPENFEPGAHRLVVSSGDNPALEATLTVTKASGLAVTGADFPVGIAIGAVVLLVAGDILIAVRRRARN